MQPRDDTPSAPVAVIAKNKSEVVHVSLSEFKGTDLIDVWTDAKGKLRATAKGVCLRVTFLPELIAGLQATEAAAIRKGLLPSNDRGRA